MLNQDKSFWCHGQNVRRWFCGTNANHVFGGRNVRICTCHTKANDVIVADQNLDDGFVAKASSLNPNPNLLDLKAHIK